eukprot:19554-Heterococcus_DN1.PRE.2
MEMQKHPAWSWLIKIGNSFHQAPASSIDAFAATEDVQDKFADFLKGSDQVQVLYFTLSTDRNSTTAAVGKHAVYIKMDVQPISMKASGSRHVQYALRLSDYYTAATAFVIYAMHCYSTEISYGDIAPGHVYLPLLQAHGRHKNWGAILQHSVNDNLTTFSANVQITWGQVQGVTCLPLPSTAVPSDVSSSADADIEDDDTLTVVRYTPHNGHHNAKHKHNDQHYSNSTQSTTATASTAVSMAVAAAVSQDTLHALESAVITWTKQIKAVLKQILAKLFVCMHHHKKTLLQTMYTPTAYRCATRAHS